MRFTKNFMALVLALAICLSLSIPALAENSLGVTYSATLDTPTISVSNQNQTVTLTIAPNKTIDVGGVELQVECDTPIQFTAITNTTLGFTDSDVNDDGKLSWEQEDAKNVSTDLIAVITFTVPAGTSAGSYKLGVNGIELTKDYGEIWENSAEVYTTLTIEGSSPAVPVEGVTLDKTELELTVGSSATLQETVTPDNATDKSVTWESSDDAIATVENGTVTAVAAGSATITVKTVDGEKTASCAVTVKPAQKETQTITADDVNTSYGSAARIDASTNGDGELSYAVKSGGDVIEVDNAGNLTIKKIGTAIVTVTAAETDTYASAVKDVHVTVSPMRITPDITVNIPAEGYTYDGNAKTPGVTVKTSADGTELVKDSDYTLQYSSNVDAGENTAKVTVSPVDGGNYVWEPAAERTFSIAKGAQTISGGDFSVRVGSSVDLDEVFHAPGALTYEITDANGTGSSVAGSTLTAGSAAGTLTLKVTAAETANYQEAEKTVTVTVNEKEQQIIRAESVRATYGDTNIQIMASVTTGDGALSYAVTSGNDIVDVNNDGKLTIKHVGSAVITVTAAETAQYAMQTKDVEVTIQPRKITPPAADTSVYIYNGKAQTYRVTSTADYTVSGNVQTDANETGYIVTVTLADTENTVWSDTNDTIDKTFSFVIGKATITITADSKSAYVKSGVPALTYTVTGLADGETLKTEPAISYEEEPDMSKAGTVAILVSGAEAPDGDNYNDIIYVNGKLTISAKPSGGGSVRPSRPSKPSTPSASKKNPFVDVPAGSYYEDAVIWAVDKGITTGVSASRFDPNGICTRAQAVAFLWRAAGSPAPKFSAMPFVDVPTGSYYYDAVLWAVENGITKGTSDTTFSPNATCTRAQIVTFLWRSQNAPAAGSSNPFADVAAGDYYADAVLWAVKENVTKGTGNTTFSPDDNCTRAQIVTFLWRTMA